MRYLRAKKGGKDSVQFDVRRQNVRDWWSGVAGKAVHNYGCDGIFVDGATAGRQGGPWSKMFGAKQAAAMDEGVFAMLRQARGTMGPGKLIISNPLHGYDENHPGLGEPYLPVTDGAMVSPGGATRSSWRNRTRSSIAWRANRSSSRSG